MRSEKSGDKGPAQKGGGRQGERADRNVGDALRAVYQDAVSETIPDEMLDLLNKLG